MWSGYRGGFNIGRMVGLVCRGKFRGLDRRGEVILFIKNV
jgi:hypothetical protein